MNRVVTIDGPAGSGKSTIAAKLAKKLGFVHLNSGLLYRAAGFLGLRDYLSLHNSGVEAALKISKEDISGASKLGEAKLNNLFSLCFPEVCLNAGDQSEAQGVGGKPSNSARANEVGSRVSSLIQNSGLCLRHLGLRNLGLKEETGHREVNPKGASSERTEVEAGSLEVRVRKEFFDQLASKEVERGVDNFIQLLCNEAGCSEACFSNSKEAALVEDGEEEEVLLPERFLKSRLVSILASKVAIYPEVRASVTEIQRDLAKTYPLVLEGRDAGSVVFPDADFKFYLDASLEERTKRMLKANVSSSLGEEVLDSSELSAMSSELEERDARDRGRNASPHIVPEGAVRVDTTLYNINEVLAVLCSAIER